MNLNDSVSMIFCSCDAYSDLWENFFKLLRKYWPEFDGEIILNTESRSIQYNGFTISEPLNCGKDVSWSQRLAWALDRAKNPWVLIVLEDFYLKAPVDHAAFCKTLAYMQENPNVASVTYLREPGTSKPEKALPGFFFRKQFSLYKMTAHITLYRKDYLRALLKKDESAWEFEVNGTSRSWFKRGVFLGPENNKQVVFPYDFGCLILRGKYYGPVKRRFESSEQLSFLDCRETLEQRPEGSSGSVGKKLMYLMKGLLSIFKENA